MVYNISEQQKERQRGAVAEKDIAQKVLEAYNDVFADIVNGLLFEGKDIILPDDLEDHGTHSHYKTDGRLREQARDVAKKWKKGEIKLSLIGMENQTGIDTDMPFRVIGYDGAEYRSQLSGKERYPVLTLVLYFGTERPWTRPRSLFEQMEIPEIFRPYLNDYKINVFEIAYLTDEQVKLFKSDFRIIADYFVQKRKNGTYEPEPHKLRHIQETLQTLTIFSGDHRFEEVYNENMERSDLTMCEMLERTINERSQQRVQQGIQQGIQQGVQLAEKNIALLSQKLSAANRANELQHALEDFNYLHKLMEEFNINQNINIVD